ncbi:MAG: hypothetical protein IKE38_02560 [Erysipelotrichaceae bacterium]|nr:hypothetical protein [Erysipelotrichaceae bacterium]
MQQVSIDLAQVLKDMTSVNELEEILRDYRIKVKDVEKLYEAIKDNEDVLDQIIDEEAFFFISENTPMFEIGSQVIAFYDGQYIKGDIENNLGKIGLAGLQYVYKISWSNGMESEELEENLISLIGADY